MIMIMSITDSSISVDFDDNPPLHHTLQPLDSSVLRSGSLQIPADDTPYSDYQQLVRRADVMKATRGREVQGGATPPPPATDRPINETSTPHSDPLHVRCFCLIVLGLTLGAPHTASSRPFRSCRISDFIKSSAVLARSS